MLVSLESIHQGNLPAEQWKKDALTGIQKSIETPGFPCVYAVSGYKKVLTSFHF
ncbi:hypothetical protein [Lactococcus termiticola]|uniref:Uncharacterized protein n=1 Tax=Lactococcus termiticola TaxID=2169526 RepID=A0A2R5HDI9_9LACT|nr:hypothetical protein [Lactococcus termiticola]GBG96133.1 hypothetical protein NtB2_00238 [Lactococcus termiticola]